MSGAREALVVVLALLALLSLAWYLSWTASCLYRLHARVEVARSALYAQPVRRSSISLDTSTIGLS